ncbi:MAG: hypothetical protein QNJ51_08130 [Calothrix sp. MO_167.B12]|nr:hypothetical protein [Calothrix sp. MO_167.B12]
MQKLILASTFAAVIAINAASSFAQSVQKQPRSNTPVPKTTLSTPVSADERFAMILKNGAIAHGTQNGGVVSAKRLAVGQYEVIFNRNVAPCAFNATLGNVNAGVANPGFITVADRFGNQNGVFVDTRDMKGVRVDSSFHLSVHCNFIK